MQRSICRWVGACGLIFTVNTFGQAAGGGAAGGAGGGGTAAGAGRAAPAQGSQGNVVRGTAPARGATVNNNGANGAGRSVTTAPGQSLTSTPGQSLTAAPGQSAPAAVGGNSATPTIGGPNSNAGVVGGANTTPQGQVQNQNLGAGRSMVSFSSLPPTVQSSIAAQVPVGAQLGGVIQETTANGGTTYRAQIMQNGVVSEMAISGVGTTGAGVAGSLPGVNNSGALPAAGGVAVGSPFAYGSLPIPVQNAFASQAAGAPVTDVSFVPGLNGSGIYRGLANGAPVEVRVGANGYVLPGARVAPNVAAAAPVVPASTNTVVVDDLPMAVRDALKNSTPFAEVSGIRKSESPSGDLYDITLRGEGRVSQLQIAENGTIIRENHDLPVLISATAPALTNEPPTLQWNTLPAAVRDAISVHAKHDAVRSLLLTNFEARTAYAVDYVDREGLRNRLYIGKDGLVVDTQTNIFRVAMTGKPVVLDDLPIAARAAIEEQSNNAAITRIDLAMRGLEPVYVVSYQDKGELRQMVVSREGLRMDDAVGAPATSATGDVSRETALPSYLEDKPKAREEY